MSCRDGVCLAGTILLRAQCDRALAPVAGSWGALSPHVWGCMHECVLFRSEGIRRWLSRASRGQLALGAPEDLLCWKHFCSQGFSLLLWSHAAEQIAGPRRNETSAPPAQREGMAAACSPRTLSLPVAPSCMGREAAGGLGTQGNMGWVLMESAPAL